LGMWLEPHHFAGAESWVRGLDVPASGLSAAVRSGLGDAPDRPLRRRGIFPPRKGADGGEVQIFALPLLRLVSRERTYQIIWEMERLDGCTIYDPHVITIEDGGMKEIDTTQIDFKKQADRYGLLNPGKTRGWTPDMAKT
jgi:hypothetical protein